MGWQLLLTISVFSFSFSFLFQRKLANHDKVDSISYAIGFQFLVSIFIGLFALAKGFNIPNLSPLLPNLGLMIFLYSTGNVFKFNALKLIEVSKYTVLFPISAIFSVITAVAFLNESFLPIQILGLFSVISGITLIAWTKQKFTFSKGEIFVIINAALFGIAFVNDAYILRSFNAPTYAFFAFLVPAVTTGIIYPKKTRNSFILLKKGFLEKYIMSALLYAVAVVTIYLAYQLGRNAAQIQSLNQTSTILTIILAAIFLKERDKLPRKIIAGMLGVIGVILLT